ncbi:hypothetical protein HZH66_002808 [Vespula vulgaris]|uniref:Uncharacterized protein n=1 Tax=Vespula vulgaris TaxID=7454 RepID=A0A834KQE5_VESVU|nr:hypothetical protein HZH66_002808 [Vespula vulgaris]
MAGLGGAIREGRRGSIKWGEKGCTKKEAREIGSETLALVISRISIVAIGRAKIPELPCTIDKWIPLVESRQDRSSSPIELAPRLSGDSSKSQTLRSGNQIAVEYADNSLLTLKAADTSCSSTLIKGRWIESVREHLAAALAGRSTSRFLDRQSRFRCILTSDEYNQEGKDVNGEDDEDNDDDDDDDDGDVNGDDDDDDNENDDVGDQIYVYMKMVVVAKYSTAD